MAAGDMHFFRVFFEHFQLLLNFPLIPRLQKLMYTPRAHCNFDTSARLVMVII